MCQIFTGPFGNPYSFSYTPPFCASVRHRSELQQFAAKDLILNANREIGDKARVRPKAKPHTSHAGGRRFEFCRAHHSALLYSMGTRREDYDKLG